MPELDPEDEDILYLFLQCGSQWESTPIGGMVSGSRRTCLPIERVEKQAARFGIGLDEFAWDRLRMCIDMLIAYDSQRVANLLKEQ
jgi:hypothetical protein